MSRSRVILLAAGWLALAVLTAQQFRTAAGLQAASATAAAEHARLKAAAATLAREHDAIRREIAQAEQQLTALPVISQTEATGTPQPAVSAWLKRMAALRESFAANPALRIPEMAHLTEDDWMRTALVAALETEDGLRIALAQIRSIAVEKFMVRVRAAMRKHVEATKGATPADLRVLVNHADESFDTTILERYEIIERRTTTAGAPTWGIQLKTAVDPDYDSRMEYSPTGLRGNSGPFAWDTQLAERHLSALRAYSRAHRGDSARSIGDLLPFFDPPLDPATVERLKRVEESRRP